MTLGCFDVVSDIMTILYGKAAITEMLDSLLDIHSYLHNAETIVAAVSFPDESITWCNSTAHACQALVYARE